MPRFFALAAASATDAVRRIPGVIAVLLALALPGVAQSQSISAVAGTGEAGFTGDGQSATSAQVASPSHVALDSAGNVYIADTSNHRIRKVAAGTGDISTVAGNGIQGFSGDGGAATAASLFFPEAVAIGPGGDLYITDTGNNRIRKVTASTGTITTVVGNGTLGFAGDGGPATSASLYYPSGIAVDAAGTIYFSDSFNHRVRTVAVVSGTINTLAGNGVAGFAGDGASPAQASLHYPSGLALDSGGSLYVADSFNHRVRRIGSTITTVAGIGTAGYSGDGGLAVQASLQFPEGVATDFLGNIFIADAANNRIRVIAPDTAFIWTVAGSGVAGDSGDGGPATAATLRYPKGLGVDSSGNLLLADKQNHKVRKVLFASRAITDLNGDLRSDMLYRNTSTGQVYVMQMNGLSITSGGLAHTEPNTDWKVIGDADFNGDAVTDLLWRNSTTGMVWLQTFASTGLPTGGVTVMTEPNAAWKIVHTPDINGDGNADLLWWNSSTGQVYAMLMNGASIVGEGMVYQDANTAWKIVATGDFSGTGKHNQLLWRNATSGQVYLMTVTASGGTFSQTGQMIFVEANTAWKIIGAADFNDDGKSDILWRNDATGQVYMMLMNGGAITAEALVYTEANLAWKIVSVGDYNGDAKADLLWRNDTTGQVYMMLMNGLSIATQGMVYAEPNTAWILLGPVVYAEATGSFASADAGTKLTASTSQSTSMAGEPRNAGKIGGEAPRQNARISGFPVNGDHKLNRLPNLPSSGQRAPTSLLP